ncbi:MAG: response regulator [Oligoflexus sp.]
MNNKQKILIVDDEFDVAEVLAVLLEDYCDVDICESGEEALEKILLFSYDALITDLEMPDLPGLSLITQVKSLQPHLKLFVSTGHTKDHPLVLKAQEVGISGIIFKPFTETKELVKILSDEHQQIPLTRLQLDINPDIS